MIYLNYIDDEPFQSHCVTNTNSSLDMTLGSISSQLGSNNIVLLVFVPGYCHC